MEGNIDENLYSRQIGAYGFDTMKKLTQLRVLVQGMRGLGFEVAKNLILAGLKQVTINDDEPVAIEDLSSNFFLSEEHVANKLTRTEATLSQFQELNPNVQVDIHKGEITSDLVKNFDVVVFTNYYGIDCLTKINECCRSQEKPIGFIWTGVLGLYGFCFVDYGPEFQCLDPTGKDPIQATISSITKETQGFISSTDDQFKKFKDGDTVLIKEASGMSQLNGLELKIQDLSATKFSIGDTSKYCEYTNGGIIEQVKKPCTIFFQSLADSLNVLPENFPLVDPDIDEQERSSLLHKALRCLLNFCKQEKRLPRLNDKEDAKQFVSINSNADNLDLHHSNSENKDIITNISLFAKANISPHCSFWGGIVAQEVVKYTGKFNPLQQWLHYDTFSTLPEAEDIDRRPVGGRFDDIISIYGQDFLEKLSRKSFFMVGAGALGCEYLKMFSLMGVASGEGGKLTVTDDDNIEKSNLNRQFLFREKDAASASSKSKVACEAVKQMNSSFNVEAKQLRVGPENEENFTDEFWEGLTAVISAVDNVEARKYLDNQCVFFKKPFLEAGTLGVKCSSIIVLPEHTENYSTLAAEQPVESATPFCTLRGHPSKIEHTIEWARDKFESIFVQEPNDYQKTIADAEYHPNDSQATNSSQKELLKALRFSLEFKNPNVEGCIRLAIEAFHELFYDSIVEQLETYSDDCKTEDGSLYWSGTRRKPVPIRLDLQDELHITFIIATFHLYANLLNISENNNHKQIQEIAEKLINSENKYSKLRSKQEIKKEIEYLTEQLKKTQESKEIKLSAIEFEKDTDIHVDFISSAANLRARNYNIAEAEKHKIRAIAGKIVPAVATTTAMVVGFVGFELIKLILNKDPKMFRNMNANLIEPSWTIEDVCPPARYNTFADGSNANFSNKAIPKSWTCWDFEEVSGPKTIQEIFDYYREKYSIEITAVYYGDQRLYSSRKKTSQNRLQLTPYKILQLTLPYKIGQKKYLQLHVAGKTLDSETLNCQLPAVKYTTNE